MSTWLPTRYHFKDRGHRSHEGSADLDEDDLSALMARFDGSFANLFIVVDRLMALRLDRYGPDMFQIVIADEMTSQWLDGYFTNADAKILLLDLLAFGFDEDQFSELAKWGERRAWDSQYPDYWINRWLAEGIDEKTIRKRLRTRGLLKRRRATLDE
jgi:hypothetical protein